MMPTFDESLVSRKTPWAALDALETYLAQGGRCLVPDSANWIGIVFTCARKAEFMYPEEREPALHEALVWARLAIEIREAMAKEFPENETVGTITGAMFVRASMIIRCENHPGDPICDCDKLIEWALGLPGVQEALKITDIPPISYVPFNARSAVEIFTGLVEGGRIEAKGDVGRLIDLIAKAKEIPDTKTVFQGEISDLVDILVGRKKPQSSSTPSSIPVQWVEGEF